MRAPDSRTAENGEPSIVAEDISGVAAPFAGLRETGAPACRIGVSAPRVPVRLNEPLLVRIPIRHALF